MPKLIERPPPSDIEVVTDVLHGLSIDDPYRWLEDHDSPRTRVWLERQTRYARAYLDTIQGRERIRKRVREMLDVETYDSFVKTGNRYFFRKRLPGQEQPSIYVRDGALGEDQLLVDPSARGTGDHTAVRPLCVSPDGSLLVYEVKEGGERAGIFEILHVPTRTKLPDSLPHGFLRGLAFAPDAKSFYYVHEAIAATGPFYRAAFHHVLGCDSASDQEIFTAGEGASLRLILIPGRRTLGFLVRRFLDRTYTDFYLRAMGKHELLIPVLRDAQHLFAPRLLPGRILASLDQDSPNCRIVEVQPQNNQAPRYFDLVGEQDVRISSWAITANHIVTSYVRGQNVEIAVFDHFGKRIGQIPVEQGVTVRIVGCSTDDDEALLERESFTRPIEIVRCDLATGVTSTWARRPGALATAEYDSIEVGFASSDGTMIPVSLAGRVGVLADGTHPAIMTSYGGFGVSSTPQFSVFVALLMERGCLFALPNIRGGSEFGTEWHAAAKRRNRQTAFNDFLAAAEWLVQTARTTPHQLGIFGGSNSGLLVGVALTQRPALFGAVLCMVPLLDMLRYHKFDSARFWSEEFGTAEDFDDFEALARYSPYHHTRDGVGYPAAMFVSGDADGNCNPLHARKMVARLQAANASSHPIILDYAPLRGHSPVLPLSARIEALTDRIAFFSDALGVAAEVE